MLKEVTFQNVRLEKLQPAGNFRGLAEATWGYNPIAKEDVLLYEVAEPVFLPSNLDHNGVFGIPAYQVVPAKRSDGKSAQALAYTSKGLDRAKARNVGEWLRSAQSDLGETIRRTKKLVEFIKKIEQAANDKFFFPYLAPSTLAWLEPKSELVLWGAPLDLRRLPDDYVHDAVLPYFDPSYLGNRDIDPSPERAYPQDLETRKRYLRYGLTHQIMELAYGRSIHDTEQLSALRLESHWASMENLFDQHGRGNAPLEVAPNYYDLLIDALAGIEKGRTSTFTPEVVADLSASQPTITPTPTLTPTLESTVTPIATPDLSPKTPQATQDDQWEKVRAERLRKLKEESEKRDSRHRWSMRWRTLAWLFLGAILGAAILGFVGASFYGVDWLDPAKLAKLTADNRQMKVDQLLRQWVAQPENRNQLSQDIQKLDEGNINLAYLELVHLMDSPENNSEVASKFSSFLTSLKDKPLPENAWFTTEDVERMVAITARGAKQ